MKTIVRPVEILMVEDNPGDVELSMEALRDGRLLNRIHLARDGEEALEFLYKRHHHTQAPTPDIILLDLNMPRMSGIEFLRIIKNEDSLKHIPVVILTSSEADKDVLTSYREHANCYLVKPVDLDKFLAVIKSLAHFWLHVVTLPPETAQMETHYG